MPFWNVNPAIQQYKACTNIGEKKRQHNAGAIGFNGPAKTPAHQGAGDQGGHKNPEEEGKRERREMGRDIQRGW